MRIGINFHSFDRYISGVEYYCLGLLRALLSIDDSNEYFVWTNQPDLINRYVQTAPNLRIFEVSYLRTRIARIIWEHTQLPRLAARQRIQVLHYPSYICSIFKSTVPYVVTIHDTIAIDHPEWCKRTNALYFRLFMKHAIQRAACVIAVSHCTAKDLNRHFGLDPSKVRVIYPGIDHIFKTEGVHNRYKSVRTRYGLPERYIIYVGNLEPKKNISMLLTVIKRLRKLGFYHKLVITGQRSWRCKTELSDITEAVTLGELVFTGYVERDDLPYIYQMSDLLLFPSLYEGFGFPPLEAMACGTPVVTSNRGALGENIGEAAMIVRPSNVKQVIQTIISLITDDFLREKYIHLGLKRSSMFDWEKAARKTFSVYKELS